MCRIQSLKGLIVTTAACACLSIATAQAEFANADRVAVSPSVDGRALAAAERRLASRDTTKRYFTAYNLIGSHVLNLAGQRIGQVENLILDDRGDIARVIVTLSKSHDGAAEAIAISPQRTEVVSFAGAHVSVIRIDMTHREILQAQIVRLKPNARAPARRGAGSPDMHRDSRPLY